MGSSSFPSVAEDDNAHSDQAHRSSDNIPTTGALTFDQPQPGEGGGDVDAAISGISSGRRPLDVE
jgi:hypothetical protein